MALGGRCGSEGPVRFRDDPASGVPTFFLPLRMSVELFLEDTPVDAVTRAKQAALLFDEVYIEDGLVDVTLTDGGPTELFWPAEHLTDELLERTRQPIQMGKPMTIAFGEEPEPGVPPPASEMRVMAAGTMMRRYLAEFHTGILDELAGLEASWLRVAKSAGASEHSLLGRSVSGAAVLNKEVLPGEATWLRKFAIKAFIRDTAVSDQIGAVIGASPLFRPLLATEPAETEPAGAAALSIVCPDVGRVPWEAICEFREHAGAREAREQLAEIDRSARASEPAANAEHQTRVSTELTRALLAAVTERSTNVTQELVREGLGVAVSLIPGASLVPPVANLVHAVRRDRTEDRSWVAALMSLTNIAPR